MGQLLRPDRGIVEVNTKSAPPKATAERRQRGPSGCTGRPTSAACREKRISFVSAVSFLRKLPEITQKYCLIAPEIIPYSSKAPQLPGISSCLTGLPGPLPRLSCAFLRLPGPREGSPRESQKVPWSPRDSQGLFATPWGSLGVPRTPWAFQGLPGLSKPSLGLPGLPWAFLGLPSPPWASLRLPGPPWASLGLPEHFWASLAAPPWLIYLYSRLP